MENQDLYGDMKWEDFSEKNFLIAINGNGKISSIPRDPEEKEHWQMFNRLNENLDAFVNAKLKELDMDDFDY